MRALDYKDIDTEKSTVRPSERDCPSEHSGDYLSGGGGGGEGVLILRATSILKNQGATNALWKNNFSLRMVASFVLVILTWANFLVDQPSLSTFVSMGNSIA